jgi:uncharacterized protein (DUF486 family)
LAGVWPEAPEIASSALIVWVGGLIESFYFIIALRASTFIRKEPSYVITIVLLTISNVFMTFAWYGHLKYRQSPLYLVILASWGIAFFEYCFQVPANRWGYGEFSAAQLKTIQEAITLTVFSVFSVLYLREEFRWNYLVGFILIVLAVFVIFHKW